MQTYFNVVIRVNVDIPDNTPDEDLIEIHQTIMSEMDYDLSYDSGEGVKITNTEIKGTTDNW